MQHNIGLETGLFANRLNLTADIFNNQTTGMYYLTGAENFQGVFQWINAGNFSNKGIDISLSGLVISNNDFNMKLFLNLSGNRTKITEVNTEIQNITREVIPGIASGQALKTGDQIGVYYGLKTENIDVSHKVIEYQDIDRNGVVNESDMVKIADSNPKLYGGGGMEIGIRNFRFVTVFKLNLGNKVINVNGNIIRSENYSNNISPETDNVLTDNDIETGSFLRLSDIGLTYTLPKQIYSNSGIRQVKLKLNAINALTFSKYSGQDPEFNNWVYKEREAVKILPGIDRNYYPVSRSFVFSIQMDF